MKRGRVKRFTPSSEIDDSPRLNSKPVATIDAPLSKCIAIINFSAVVISYPLGSKGATLRSKL